MVLISQFFYFKELSVKVEAETTLNKTLKSLSDANQVFSFSSILVSVFRRFARKKCTKNTLDFGYNHHTQDAGMCQSTVQYLKPKCDNVKIS